MYKLPEIENTGYNLILTLTQSTYETFIVRLREFSKRQDITT